MVPFRSRILPALLIAGFAALLSAQAPPALTGGVGDLLVAPTRVVFEGRKRSAELNLSNIGTARATYRVSLIRMEMDESGGFKEKGLDPGAEGIQSLFRFSPREVTLEPQESQTVRIQVRKPAELPAGEYRLHIVFRAVPTTAPIPAPVEAPKPSPAKVETPKAEASKALPPKVEDPKRSATRTETPKSSPAKAEAPKHTPARKPAEATTGEPRRDGAAPIEAPAVPPVSEKEEAPKGISIRLTPVYGIAIPLIVRHGDTAAKIVISEPTLGEGARSLRFRLERSGNQSVYGDLQATLLPPTGSPVVLSEIAGLAVYTPNPSRVVTMPLPATPVLSPGSRIRITYALPTQDGGTQLAETYLAVP